ncbi:hypothetical protein GGX14DRAFT_557559 [Mycena pura]|uniref:Uncharacterized protein n=1 Tax=Mycena pura TaxID=153505 RepID=A0AAD7E2L8_9AGAR|nr:hypothetical protein GGX14DRAFT_557559 [Mycena pura]
MHSQDPAAHRWLPADRALLHAPYCMPFSRKTRRFKLLSNRKTLCHDAACRLLLAASFQLTVRRKTRWLLLAAGCRHPLRAVRPQDPPAVVPRYTCQPTIPRYTPVAPRPTTRLMQHTRPGYNTLNYHPKLNTSGLKSPAPTAALNL